MSKILIELKSKVVFVGEEKNNPPTTLSSWESLLMTPHSAYVFIRLPHSLFSTVYEIMKNHIK